MTDRELPIVDGAAACPFVAFEDDRDERATSPDHRHRCYAEVRPAPRALAHQEAYCLSSAFPVCPTFQDWARREAARTRDAGAAAPLPVDEEPRRNPPRDWSAPPPWNAEPDEPRPEGAAAAGGFEPPEPDFLAGRSGEGRGLAGSSADLLAGDAGEPPGASPVEASPRGPEQAALRGPEHAAPAGYPETRDEWAEDEDEDEQEREPRRGGPGLPFDRRPRVGQARPRRAEPAERGPSWERPRRYEAYPTIRTRIGLPPVPPIAMMAGAVLVAAVALFFLPALLGFGDGDRGTGTATPSPSSSAGPSGSAEPTAIPAPTPQVYIVRSGDTMSSIARQFGVSLDDLIAANHDTVPNPDRLDVGDELIIPGPSPSPGASASGEASASP